MNMNTDSNGFKMMNNTSTGIYVSDSSNEIVFTSNGEEILRFSDEGLQIRGKWYHRLWYLVLYIFIGKIRVL